MNHARDTATSFQDDRRTRKCRNRALPNRLRTLWNPQKHPLESPGDAPEHPPSRPRTPRGAPRSRQGENMQTAAEGAPTPPSQPEHLGLLGLPSPPRSKPTFNPSSSHRSRLPAPAGPPPPPDPWGLRILLGCAHGRRPRKRSPNKDTLRGLEGTRIDCPKNVDMLNRFKH